MTEQLRVLDLFSGIGGFSLGLERAGMKTVAFCEIDPFCRRVLKKHWPEVPVYQDVTKLCRRVYDCEQENEDGDVICPRCTVEFGDCDCIGTDQFLDEVGAVDVVCGGFPCQDISLIGKRAGIGGSQSSLWFEQHRIIRELEPRFVVIENVSALLGAGLAVVLQGLDEIGYDAQWHCITASAVGAPHKRERCWIVANSRSEGLQRHSRYVEGINKQGRNEAQQIRPVTPQDLCGGENPAAWWKSQPGIRRVVDGVPDYVDRIKSLGNAVVPQIPELIGRAIMATIK